MIKRVAAGLMWFYVVWVAWNMVAWITGWTVFAGPVVATAAAAFIAVDPMHAIWPTRPSTDRVTRRLESIISERGGTGSWVGARTRAREPHPES